VLPSGLLSCYHEHMSDTSGVNTKTRKRRATQTGALIGVRMQPEPLALLDGWRRKQPDLPSRAEAIRRLLTSALE